MSGERLIEPLAPLHGGAARAAIEAGAALPLAGSAAFALCRLIEPGCAARIVPVREVPQDWAGPLAVLAAAPPPAGLPPGPQVMGILNATPDSFSDGGRHTDAAAAIAAGFAMAEAGAALVDVGGESTRPGADPVSPAEEQARILPVVVALAAGGVRVSVDTRHAATMRAALDAGAVLVNDVSALAHDPQARTVVAGSGRAAILMHMRGTPQTMAGLTRYDDVVLEVTRSLGRSIEAAVAAGIDRARLLVDPGIGFAKTTDHNLALLARLPILANLGCRVVLGASRKGFIGQLAASDGRMPAPAERDPGSIAAWLAGPVLPDMVLRVHDVPGTVQALRVWRAIHA